MKEQATFTFSDAARQANEISMGIPYCKQARTPMDMLDKMVKPSVCESYRQIAPRGTVYLQMGRKASMDSIRKIIAKY